ncbi:MULTISPECIES: hypothetical protein [Halolamina]|uniref:Uncharacterized protein n=1 Tax=Halolamina pelagica TaxID=699431 RepID=A0A1I5M719_9EURY|nr:MULTISPECIES: hypothetical protein [Halolamina]NHX35893.1 hypothetical protein [Halolamina sp. R1-12]SFP05310.1 hypothetical protein SAMN05216277_101132 [Halolamina pelagica]
MLDSRALGLLATGVTSALALGGLATFLRLLPDSPTMAASAATFALCAVAVAAGVAAGTGNRPTETAYWS